LLQFRPLRPDKSGMTPKEIDFIFPFVVFAYGAVVTFVVTNPTLVRLAEERLPSDIWEKFQAKRPLGLFCIVVGGIWSLQNIWL
jgi:hypothetical protein